MSRLRSGVWLLAAPIVSSLLVTSVHAQEDGGDADRGLTWAILEIVYAARVERAGFEAAAKHVILTAG